MKPILFLLASFCLQFSIAQDNVYMDNAKYLYAKTSSGTSTRTLGINSSDDLYLGSVDAYIGNLLINLNGNNRIAVNGTTGFVGIGHINPQSKLHVSTGDSGDAILTLEADTDNNNESDNPEIVFRQDGGLVNGFIGFEGDANAKSIGTLANAFILGSNDVAIPRAVQFISGGERRMTIIPEGIGVGTSAPTSILDVKSSNSNRVRFNSNDTPSISFIPNNGNSHFHISHALNNRLSISQGSNVGVDHLLTVVNSGNVGIGTITPDAKLAVKGSIHAEEVKVDLSVPGPDYVFKEGYDLKSLEEVQNYIKENGRLPNIPSAKDMEANGIQLGEMNMKLLEKIEELVLYTIKQEIKIKRLEASNDKIYELEESSKKQNREIEKLKEMIKAMKK